MFPIVVLYEYELCIYFSVLSLSGELTYVDDFKLRLRTYFKPT